MARVTWLANELRADPVLAPLVHEVGGWQSRGYDFPGGKPHVVVCHHTAGACCNDFPSYNILVNGRSGLPGPLCNVGISRSGGVYVIAAGKANHAGTGGWAGGTSNYDALGIEVENNGVGEPWTERMLDITARVAAAMCRGMTKHVTLVTERSVCEHKEWAPTRKIDRYGISGDATRARVATLLRGGPGPQPPSTVVTEGDDMAKSIVGKWAGDRYVVVGLGSDNHTLYSRWWHPQHGWGITNWQALGNIVGEFDVAVGNGIAGGQFHVMAVAAGSHEAVHWVFMNDAWHGPEGIGGYIGEAVNAESGLQVITRKPDLDPSIGYCLLEGLEVRWIKTMNLVNHYLQKCGQAGPTEFSAEDFDSLIWKGPSNNPKYKEL